MFINYYNVFNAGIPSFYLFTKKLLKNDSYACDLVRIMPLSA